MKHMTKWLSVLLALVLCASCLPASAAGTYGTKTALYQMYADGMLFQQGRPAIFAGTAVGGSVVQCVLLDEAGQAVAKAEGPVNKSNRFSVALDAPEGSYAEYTVELRLDGTLFCTLRRVVFGELWLASGQSNMDYPLGQSDTGSAMMYAGTKGSRWLRFYQTPAYVEYNGSTELFPLDAQRDIPGGVWFDGESDAIYGVSAAAYFFAEKLQKELDMPVGVLQSSLGGSSIFSWLSRESVDGDAQIKQYLQEHDRYFPAGEWQESGHNVYNDMTVNYNKKIAPLRVFRPKGMIWYQGETEIFAGVSPAMYSRAFDCMQRQHSRLFGYAEGELLPIVYSQIVSFNYGGSALQQMNDGFARMQSERPRVRAVTPVYDISMEFIPAVGYIHPMTKQPVGERMAYAAEGLVYGKGTDAYSAPYPTRVEARDGCVYVTLLYTGSGLTVRGARAAGFAVTDGSGVYVPAEAQIINGKTLRIFSPTVKNPTAASYAFAQMNAQANVYATDENGLALPVSPFITDPDALRQAWQSRDWAECDEASVWRLVNDEYTGFYDTWQSDGAELSFGGEGVSGGALQIVSDDVQQFTVQPVTLYNKDGKMRVIPDTDTDYSRYGAVTFSVRNTGSADVHLDGVRLYTSQQLWFAPAVNGTDDPDCVIPADDAWHEITLDLDTLFRRGNECGATYSRRRLSDVREIRLYFTDPGGKGAQLSIDAFRFKPEGTDGRRVRFVPRFDAADNAWEWFCAACMWLLQPFSEIG